jgi:hypothetical protein
MGRAKGDGKHGPDHPRSQVRRRIDSLVREAGLPANLALQVAKDQITLNEAVKQMAAREQVENLIARFDLNRSLATQVVRGDTTLEHVLEGQRREDHRSLYGEQSVLEDAAKDGKPRIFGLHGHRLVRAVVKSLNKYDVELVADGPDGAPAGVLGTVHKLQFKFGASVTDLDAIRSALGQDPERFAIAEPVIRPHERYRCSDKRFFSWLDAGAEVEVTTLEGEVITGPLRWIARFEIGVSVAKDLDLVVFRHAIANVSGGKWDSGKEG